MKTYLKLNRSGVSHQSLVIDFHPNPHPRISHANAATSGGSVINAEQVFGAVIAKRETIKQGLGEMAPKVYPGAEEKPYKLDSIDCSISKLYAMRESAAKHIAGLTLRQHEIMQLVLAGHPSKNIATALSISQRTVENHRAAIMKKTGSKSLAALVRLAVAASLNGAEKSHVQDDLLRP